MTKIASVATYPVSVQRPESVWTERDRSAFWRASVQGLPDTPTLSDEAISRESIYSDRG